MQIVGINMKEVRAKRIAEYNGPISVNSNSNISNVDELEIPGVNKKGLSITFEFNCEYQTEKKNTFAEIVFNGNILWLVDNPADVAKSWKKDRKLPEEVSIATINSIVRKCATRALFLSEELNLPPPIALPFAAKKDDSPQHSQRYIG